MTCWQKMCFSEEEEETEEDYDLLCSAMLSRCVRGHRETLSVAEDACNKLILTNYKLMWTETISESTSDS